MKREERKVIAQETLRIIKDKTYKTNRDTKVELSEAFDKSLSKTKVWTDQALEELTNQSGAIGQFNTEIEVTDEDAVSGILRLTESHSNVMCLNFASAKNPGGGFINGAVAQEEALAISSNLYETQYNTNGFYDLHRNIKSCIYTDTMIYSPEVVFFRNHSGALLESPVKCNIITAAAVNTGVVKQREPEQYLKVSQIMEQRIEKLLSLALHHNNEVLILGAWGCGVFQNDPVMIAELFRKQINGRFRNQFRKISFAVYSKRTCLKLEPDIRTESIGISGKTHFSLHSFCATEIKIAEANDTKSFREVFEFDSRQVQNQRFIMAFKEAFEKN